MLLDRIEQTETAEVVALDIELHIRFLQSEHERMRLIAATSLVNIGEPAVEPLVNALRERRDHVWTLAASVLVKIGEPAVGLLIEALYDEDEQVRILAVGALGRIGNARAVQPLIHAMRQEHEQVRTLMIWALVKIGRPAVDPLSAALWDSSTDVQAAAARALGEIGDPVATASLMAAREVENTEVRDAIKEALAKLTSAPERTPARAGR